MDLNRLTENDLFGRFYLKLRGNTQFDNYFQTIDVLRLFLNSKEWAEVVTGYYINITGNMDAVRLSYFTSNPSGVANCIDSFCTSNNIINSQDPEIPHTTRISEGYGGEELRFRRYLYAYTLVGLDIMSADLVYARRLIATFRLQVMLSRQPYRPHFQRTFEERSPVYNSFSVEQKEQFWQDLSNWPNPPQVNWAHMMVNMILPGDFVAQWNNFLTPQVALNIAQVNNIVRNMGFTVPSGWRPLV